MLQQYLKCMMLTGLTSYPFVAVFIQSRKAADYVACTEEAPCCFIRYFGTSDIPATTVFNVERSAANITSPAFGWSSWLPMYVSVENGHGLRAASPTLSFFSSIPLLYAYLPAVFSFQVAKVAALASNQHATQEYCQEPASLDSLHDHLGGGPCRNISLACVLLWTLLKIAHDWALLSGKVEERLTLKIGIASWIFQAIACVSAFLWAVGAAEVFISTSVEREIAGLACYYKLHAANVLLTVAPACLLWYTAQSKLTSLMLSVLHGDYLYAIVYDVPFRVVHATAPLHPTSSLLTIGLHGDRHRAPAPRPQLNSDEKREMFYLLRKFRFAWIFTQHAIIATVASGPLFCMVMAVATTQEWSFQVMGVVKCATLLAAFAPLGLCLRFSYSARYWQHKMIKGDFGAILSDLSPLRDLFWYLFLWPCGISSTMQVVPAFWHPRDDVLKECWTWSFHGIAVFVFAALLLDYVNRPVRLLIGYYDYGWWISKDALRWLNEYPEWKHPTLPPPKAYDVDDSDETSPSAEGSEKLALFGCTI